MNFPDRWKQRTISMIGVLLAAAFVLMFFATVDDPAPPPPAHCVEGPS